MEHLLQEIIPLVSEYGLIIIFVGMIFEGTAMILITGLLCYMGVFSLREAWVVSFLGAITGDHITSKLLYIYFYLHLCFFGYLLFYPIDTDF